MPSPWKTFFGYQESPLVLLIIDVGFYAYRYSIALQTWRVHLTLATLNEPEFRSSACCCYDVFLKLRFFTFIFKVCFRYDCKTVGMEYCENRISRCEY